MLAVPLATAMLMRRLTGRRRGGMLGGLSRQNDRGTFSQAITALGHHDIPSLEAFSHRDALAIDRSERHRTYRHGVISGIHVLDERSHDAIRSAPGGGGARRRGRGGRRGGGGGGGRERGG